MHYKLPFLGAIVALPGSPLAWPQASTYYLKVAARADGSFTITNSRNGYHKDYGPRS